MNLRQRDVALRELMDAPDADPLRLRRTLERFGIVNAAVSAWGTVYRRHLRPVLEARSGPARILDIGCGGGDVLRTLIARARRDGFDVSGLGIDPEPTAIEVARAHPSVAEVTFERTHSSELVARGEHFDVVVSNHLLHHLSNEELQLLLRDSAALTRGVALHADIERGPIAYAGFSLGSLPLAAGTFIRVDGLRSIRRSYTAGELHATLPAGWTTHRPAPFRLLAKYGHGH
ncbi:methyltransferase domain-containing protein [Humidisolicoccus flavus]|uniref:methyltransferase domain-containing protein n=1 Tax=Humidisolicoccus flavus TaxID=3111414 RepID=UPI00324F1FB9